ncbi:hypothetical protein [Algibacter luteus]|uniref:Uncharacterized protein n=1 Tax=Algibacter luteus TaxID=1178825 RepID=A0A1M6DMQ9_9FLAO|nr:hypothetical protein [Algibacter luteus]SHI74441.1 hypothetical protein SAMN05216261_1645 [Algibacter luteus]
MGKKYSLDTLQKFLDKYKCFEELGFNEFHINVYYLEWQGNKGNIIFNDFLWSLFNKAIDLNGDYFSSTGDEYGFYFNNYLIYSNMARFRSEEGANKKVINKFIKLAQDASYQRDVCNLNENLEYQVVIISGGCCGYCDSLNNTKYDLDYYNRKPRLDVTKCTRETGCNCCTSIIVKRDKNGRIMRK